MNLDKLCARLVKNRMIKTESLLIEHIEKHLGRVPTDAEVARCGKIMVSSRFPLVHEYRWNETPLFTIVDHERGWEGFDIISHV